MPIRVSTSPATLELSVRHAQMSIRQPHARAQISTKDAQPQFDRRPAEMSVDCTAARESMNLLTSRSFYQKYFEKGRQAALEATARTVQEGNAMAATKNPGATMAGIALGRMGENDFPSLVPGAMPSERPDITWTPHRLITDFTPHRLNINWDVSLFAEMSATRHEVNVRANVTRPPVRVSYSPPLEYSFSTLYMRA